MKKAFLKILGTILAVVLFFIAQYHIRQYYDIDPRIWFFVVYGISIVGIITILVVFYPEIKRLEKYFKTHSFSEFMIEVLENVEPMIERIKLIGGKIVDNIIYQLLSFLIIPLIILTGITYKIFFMDDFMERTIVYIVFLIMILLEIILKMTTAIILEGKERTKEFMYSGMYVAIFLINLLDFVCI